jgi:hypothetical protein
LNANVVRLPYNLISEVVWLNQPGRGVVVYTGVTSSGNPAAGLDLASSHLSISIGGTL